MALYRDLSQGGVSSSANTIEPLNQHKYEEALDTASVSIGGEMKEPNIDYAFTINDCQHPLLRFSLKLYGFEPVTVYNSCYGLYILIKRIIISICLLLAFYSIEGITHAHGGSNYITLITNCVYIFIYVTLLKYFCDTHFWKLMKSNTWKILIKNKSIKFTINFTLIISFLLSMGLATYSKMEWYKQQKNISLKHWKNFLFFIIYAITFVLRLYETFFVAIVFWVISLFYLHQIKIYKQILRQCGLDRRINNLSINDNNNNVSCEFQSITRMRLLFIKPFYWFDLNESKHRKLVEVNDANHVID